MDKGQAANFLQFCASDGQRRSARASPPYRIFQIGIHPQRAASTRFAGQECCGAPLFLTTQNGGNFPREIRPTTAGQPLRGKCFTNAAACAPPSGFRLLLHSRRRAPVRPWPIYESRLGSVFCLFARAKMAPELGQLLLRAADRFISGAGALFHRSFSLF